MSSLVAVQVAVVDPLPLFRDGAVAALAANGHAAETPTDVVAWARQVKNAVVFLTVRGEDDWAVLGRLCATEPATCSVVVLLDEDSAAAGVRAVRTGARSVLTRNASATVLRRAAAALLDGQSVLPAAVVAALAAGASVAGGRSVAVSTEKLSWLRALASGRTVAQLAEQVGYSERAMFRLLRSLYREMGVHGRVEALMVAQANGWLRLPAPR
jgi:DNA-binding NarL/FixJ family response regulator